MSVIGSAVGIAAAGSIGLMNSGGVLGMAWNGYPPNSGQQDLLYRQTWTGDSIELTPNDGNTLIGIPPHQNPWMVQPNTIRPTNPPQYEPFRVTGPAYPNTMTDEEIAASQRALEELRRYFEANPIVPQQPVVAAPPAPAPEPEGVNTEDSFRPQRKLDLD